MLTRLRLRRPLAALCATGVLALASACGTATTAPTSSDAAVDATTDQSTDQAAAPADGTTGQASTSKTSGKGAADPVAQTLDFSADQIGGGTFEGSSLAGKPVVMWFWAPWCPTCVGQIDGVGALADQFDGQVEVVGVGGLDDASALVGFADRVSPDVTLLSDPDGEVWRHFGVTAQSTYVVLDADGKPVGGGGLSDSELTSIVANTVG